MYLTTEIEAIDYSIGEKIIVIFNRLKSANPETNEDSNKLDGEFEKNE